MVDLASGRIWLGRAGFMALVVAVVLAQLIPLDLRPAGWAAPDLVLALTCVWVVRRPDLVPVFSIAAVFFATDLLLQRPPGLWSALVVILTETLRTRSRDFATMSFVAEWGGVAVGLLAITLANRLVLGVVFAPQAPLGLTLMQMAGTVVVYPLVAVLAHVICGVGHGAPGSARKSGQRP